MTEVSRDAFAAVIPAKDRQSRIGATVAAARRMCDLVVVVDDGSTDETARVAAEAGAVVVVHRRNQGKAAAMVTGATVVAEVERGRGGVPVRPLLFLDDDLEETAVRTLPLVVPVVDGRADMTIALFPECARDGGGGFGFVVGLARSGVARLGGFVARQPLSGQRCISRPAFDAALPLARGWGVEVGLTIDLRRKGYRVAEVPVELRHEVTGRDWRGIVHRGKQFAHVALALCLRMV